LRHDGAGALAAAPGWVGISWLVARFHRSRLVIAYVITTWCLALPDDWRQVSNALDDARFRPYLSLHLAGLACSRSASLLLGGALANKEAPHEIA
jgi:hypothetical protein